MAYHYCCRYYTVTSCVCVWLLSYLFKALGKGGTLSVLVCYVGSSCVGVITPDSATFIIMYVSVEESHDLLCLLSESIYQATMPWGAWR